MKKVFAVLFILLLLLGGTGFFFGWAQLTVPPGSYGVMRSKTHGIDTDLIRDGEFRWVWYKLIPTNAKISVFSPKPVQKALRVSGSLPSGDTYAALIGANADFSYEVSASLSFSIKASSLPSLMLNRGISDQADLEALQNDMAENISSFAVQRIRAYAEDRNRMEEMLAITTVRELEDEIVKAFPDIENLNCLITVVRFPDFELYESAREVYRDYLARQREKLIPDTREAADLHIAARLRFDELREYGELLTKYPVLLQYLVIEQGNEASVREIFESISGAASPRQE